MLAFPLLSLVDHKSALLMFNTVLSLCSWWTVKIAHNKSGQ